MQLKRSLLLHNDRSRVSGWFKLRFGPHTPEVKQISVCEFGAEPPFFEVQMKLWRKKNMKELKLIHFNVSHCEIELAYLQPAADKHILNRLFLLKNPVEE